MAMTAVKATLLLSRISKSIHWSAPEWQVLVNAGEALLSAVGRELKCPKMAGKPGFRSLGSRVAGWR